MASEDQSWWKDVTGIVAKNIDDAVSIPINLGLILGGTTLVGASKAAEGISYTAESFGWKTPQEHRDTVQILDQVTEFGKGTAGASTVNLASTIPGVGESDSTASDRVNESEGFWDLFLGGTADDIGDAIHAGTILSENLDRQQKDDPQLSQEQINKMRMTIKSVEDEILFAAIGAGILGSSKAIRTSIMIMSPFVLFALKRAIDTSTTVAAYISDLIISNLGLPTFDLDSDEEPESEEVEVEEDEDNVTEENQSPEDETNPEEESDENDISVVEDEPLPPKPPEIVFVSPPNKYESLEMHY